jgi:hypothetical protein
MTLWKVIHNSGFAGSIARRLFTQHNHETGRLGLAPNDGEIVVGGVFENFARHRRGRKATITFFVRWIPLRKKGSPARRRSGM